MKPHYMFFILAALTIISVAQKKDMKFTGAKGEVKIITLDPGHFHAALLQKIMYDQVNPAVYVYAPESDDVRDHLNLVNSYNARKENPTQWKEVVYTGSDFLEKMIKEKQGNVVVIAGNNRKKTEYINAAINAGMNVLADKPMAIDVANFELLKKSFSTAKQRGVLLYDIMTERSEITAILQQQISLIKSIFGNLEKGTTDNPAVVRNSTHTFYKYVSGSVLKRPAWFFDVDQQGEGIIDITTHLVDLVQWQCFPNQIIDYKKDIHILSATRWPTKLTAEEFNTVTKLKEYPEFLKKDLQNNILNVYCNGEINYTIKGVHAKVNSIWDYRAPEDAGDAAYSLIRGTKSNLIILQGAEQKYKPTLYIEPVTGTDQVTFAKTLVKSFEKISAKFVGVSLKESSGKWEVVIPEKYKVGHEAHFGEVTKRFMQYLIDGKLPTWETPNTLAKYYITTKALELAKKNNVGVK